MSKILTTKPEIENWLIKHKIKEYHLVEDAQYGYAVVVANVDLCGRNLTHVEVKFRRVNGGFYCDHNLLTSLEGCPDIVGNFSCSHNKIDSLIYSPTSVSGSFNCSSNNLTSLHYCPTSISYDFGCSKNLLSNLECAPRVGRFFYAEYNQLDTLLYLPETVANMIYIENNPLLGENQKITDFAELKKIQAIYQEREQLSTLYANKKSNLYKI